jgi:hypothetical protein
MKRSGIDQASILEGKRPWEISEGPPGEMDARTPILPGREMRKKREEWF